MTRLTTRTGQVCALAAFLASAAALPATGQTPTGAICTSIDEVIEIARRTSPEASIATANVDAQASVLDEVRAGGRPQVQAYARSFSGDSELSDTRLSNQAGLRVTQDLFDFSKRRLQADAARAEVRAAQAVVARARDETAHVAADAYLAYLHAEARQLALQSERDALSELAAALNDLSESGAVTADEVRDANARLAEVTAEMATLALTQEEALLSLEFEVGPVGVGACSVQNVRSLLTGSQYTSLNTARTVELALSNDPRIRQADALLEARDAEKEYEERSNLPTVRAIGALSYANDDLRDDWRLRDQVGLEFSIPLGTGGAKSARERGAVARRAAMQRERQLLIREIEREARLAAGAYEAGLGLTQARQAVVDDKLAQFELVSDAFDQGFRTLEDIVEVRTELSRAQLDLLQAEFAMFNAALRMRMLAGDTR